MSDVHTPHGRRLEGQGGAMQHIPGVGLASVTVQSKGTAGVDYLEVLVDDSLQFQVRSSSTAQSAVSVCGTMYVARLC